MSEKTLRQKEFHKSKQSINLDLVNSCFLNGCLLTLNKLYNLLVIFDGFKQVKNLLVILLTLNKSKTFGETPWLTGHHATPLVTFFWCHRVTYRTPCHASGHLVIYRECCRFERAFLTLRCFVPYTPSCWFQGFPGAGSSTSKLAGLYADLRNIAPTRLFVWITAIYKRDIVVGSIYVSKAAFEVRLPQPWNLSLTVFEPTRIPQPWNLPPTGFETMRVPQSWNLLPTGFKLASLKVLCVNSRLSWQSCHTVLWVLIHRWIDV